MTRALLTSRGVAAGRDLDRPHERAAVVTVTNR
jgi:hypothetical protein